MEETNESAEPKDGQPPIGNNSKSEPSSSHAPGDSTILDPTGSCTSGDVYHQPASLGFNPYQVVHPPPTMHGYYPHFVSAPPKLHLASNSSKERGSSGQNVEDDMMEERIDIKPDAYRIKIYVKSNPRSPARRLLAPGTKTSSSFEKIMTNRDRKNAMSRQRAQQLRDKIEELKEKRSEKISTVESRLLQIQEQKRQKKNERSRERELRKKAEIERILNKPESRRSKLENAFLDNTMNAKQRKNEGDRLRRTRYSGGQAEGSDLNACSGPIARASKFPAYRRKKEASDGTPWSQQAKKESTARPIEEPKLPPGRLSLEIAATTSDSDSDVAPSTSHPLRPQPRRAPSSHRESCNNLDKSEPEYQWDSPAPTFQCPTLPFPWGTTRRPPSSPLPGHGHHATYPPRQAYCFEMPPLPPPYYASYGSYPPYVHPPPSYGYHPDCYYFPPPSPEAGPPFLPPLPAVRGDEPGWGPYHHHHHEGRQQYLYHTSCYSSDSYAFPPGELNRPGHQNPHHPAEPCSQEGFVGHEKTSTAMPGVTQPAGAASTIITNIATNSLITVTEEADEGVKGDAKSETVIKV